MDDTMADISRVGDTRTLRYVRRLSGDPTTLWRLLTEPTSIARWMETRSMIFEPHVGGAVRYDWSETDFAVGVVTDVTVGRTLGYTWVEGDHSSAVRWELQPHDEGSTLTLTHRGLTPQSTLEVGAGWHSHLDGLDAASRDEPFDVSERFRALAPLYGARGAEND